MNPHEHKLAYPFKDELPQPGHTLEVAAGVYWIRMPLPFALDHINLWLIRDEIDGQQGWTIIDCGIGRDEVKTLWESVFANMLQGLPVLRVMVTHMHPDHVGLAHWLCDRWQVPLWMSMTDYMTARLWSGGENNSAAGGEGAWRHFHAHGLRDADALEQIKGRSGYYKGLVPDVPKQFIRIMDGDTVDIGGASWLAIAGYGHAPEHLSFFCADKNVLISGDMVLPRISTNVSVQNLEPMANPLPLYLQSLVAYADLPGDTLVLPSHGKPFTGLHERIHQQQVHHDERLADLLRACDTPKSAHDILPVLFKRQLDLHQMTFAMGEAIAHLHALYFDGKLKRSVAGDGLIEFVRT
jgi:glyoxylase-like metal-dependent hydrolase (beta-lactamase superfamily II)